jgi:DNA replication protein DnaC
MNQLEYERLYTQSQAAESHYFRVNPRQLSGDCDQIRKIRYRYPGLPCSAGFQSKETRSLNLRMRLAGFPVEKRLDDFDFQFQPSLDKASLKEIASMRFIHSTENVVFLGPPGVGKTHLAIALGIEAAIAGFRVNFANASPLVERLAKAEKDKKLEVMIRRLSKFQLLIVDEMSFICRLTSW